MSEIIKRNSARCKNCGDEIISKHRHDFVTCSCFKNEIANKGIYIDGGNDYLRRGGCLENIQDTSIVIGIEIEE